MRIYDENYGNIISLIAESRKNGDITRYETLKMIKWELEKGEKTTGKALTDADEEKILMAMVNKYTKSIEAYENEHLTDEANKFRAELEIIKEFAPKILSEDEAKTLVIKVIDNYITTKGADYKPSMKDMKPIMDLVRAEYSAINGKLVKDILTTY